MADEFNKTEDEFHVESVREGNRWAFAELYRKYTGQVASICWARVRRTDVVEELVQETFVKALEKIGELREPKLFSAWVSSIARNLCRDWAKVQPPESLSTDPPAPQAAADDLIAALRRCVRRLPVELREIVLTKYISKTTYQDLADRRGVSFGLINKQLTTTRRLLRECMDRGHLATDKDDDMTLDEQMEDLLGHEDLASPPSR